MYFKEDVRELFNKKFKNNNFEKKWDLYLKIPSFKCNSNIYEAQIGDQFDDEIHFIMKCVVTKCIEAALIAQKIDMTDPNITEHSNGSLGTAYRIAKMWVGDDLNDRTELCSGRFNEMPRVATFPNTENNNNIITKRVNVTGICSHHFLPFNSAFSEKSWCEISYKPKRLVIGISKLERLTQWVFRRPDLQELATTRLGNLLVKILETEDVQVRVVNVKHSCEVVRGAQNANSGLDTEFRSGIFKI